MNNEGRCTHNNFIRILILSDRLPERLKELKDYFQEKEDFKVIGTGKNKEEVLEIAKNQDFEYLIIVGYLKNEKNYTVIEELEKMNKNFLTVQWSMIDSLIISFCLRYKIPLRFERTLPLDDFADFLMEHRNGIEA